MYMSCQVLEYYALICALATSISTIMEFEPAVYYVFLPTYYVLTNHSSPETQINRKPEDNFRY